MRIKYWSKKFVIKHHNDKPLSTATQSICVLVSRQAGLQLREKENSPLFASDHSFFQLNADHFAPYYKTHFSMLSEEEL